MISVSADKPASLYVGLVEKNLQLGFEAELQALGGAIALCCNVAAIAERNQIAEIRSTTTGQIASTSKSGVDQVTIVLKVSSSVHEFGASCCSLSRLHCLPIACNLVAWTQILWELQIRIRAGGLPDSMR